jgi:hypothetical protein
MAHAEGGRIALSITGITAVVSEWAMLPSANDKAITMEYKNIEQIKADLKDEFFYEAPHIGIDTLAEQIKKIQPETRFDAVIMWREDEHLENVTMKMGLGVGADDENIFYNVENADDMFGLMVGKSDEWILVGFADGANQFNYTAL